MLFGGRTREGRVSDLYILHLDSLRWEGPIDTGTGPEPRSLHTCTLLHNNKVLLLGGMNSQGDSVLAQWVLTTTPKPSWRRVSVMFCFYREAETRDPRSGPHVFQGDSSRSFKSGHLCTKRCKFL